jgi:hypothetical protein
VKLNSKYFDSIRIAPAKAKAEAAALRKCEWADCTADAPHRAPKGRNHEGQFAWFCGDHIRDYNKNYNFFAGMTDDDVRGYQRESGTGHRPTWKMGMNPEGVGGGRFRADPSFDDTYGFFRQKNPYEREPDGTPKRPPRNAERKALQALGLDETATLADIKARYKELVKKFHPDTNGGDRAAEDRLQKVIQAYDYLKKSGFC